jgi:hypothetical protein
VTPPQENQGVDLVPSSGEKNSTLSDAAEDVGWNDVPEFEPMSSASDSSMPPLIVGLEPSVVSLQPGEKTILQIVVTGGEDSYRLPLALSFDPRRVWVDGLQAAPGVELLRSDVHAADGWIDLDVLVVNGIQSGQAVAALTVQALEGGPAPLVFTSAGAVTQDGLGIPVAANDGALFVNTNGQVREK